MINEDLSDLRIEGMRAYKKGAAESDNPYERVGGKRAPAMREAWRAGWYNAKGLATGAKITAPVIVNPISFTLPYPPTVNHYWRRTKYGMRRSDKANEYIKAVGYATRPISKQIPLGGFTGKLTVELTVYPPDKRRRDIDNVAKALLDSMQKAELYQDDNQVDRLLIIRSGDIGGYVDVCLAEL